MNEEIKRALCSAQIPSRREPIGLNINQEIRPDGITYVPWRQGRHLAWDLTVVDTVAPTYVVGTAQEAGSAAGAAEERKVAKYAGNLPPEYEFVPLGFETLGSMGPSATAFLRDLGRRLVAASGDERALEYLYQGLSLAILRGNAASVLGSLVEEDDAQDVSFGGMMFAVEPVLG
jgi:hypothetical protein